MRSQYLQLQLLTAAVSEKSREDRKDKEEMMWAIGSQALAVKSPKMISLGQ